MKPLTHKQSIDKRFQRDRHKHLLNLSYHDNIIKEIVCTRYAIAQTENRLQEKYGYLSSLNVECGEVLVDSLGRGTFQKMVEVNP